MKRRFILLIMLGALVLWALLLSGALFAAIGVDKDQIIIFYLSSEGPFLYQKNGHSLETAIDYIPLRLSGQDRVRIPARGSLCLYSGSKSRIERLQNLLPHPLAFRVSEREVVKGLRIASRPGPLPDGLTVGCELVDMHFQRVLPDREKLPEIEAGSARTELPLPMAEVGKRPAVWASLTDWSGKAVERRRLAPGSRSFRPEQPLLSGVPYLLTVEVEGAGAYRLRLSYSKAGEASGREPAKGAALDAPSQVLEALALLSARMPQRAVETLEQALQREPGNRSLLSLLALAYEAFGPYGQERAAALERRLEEQRP